MLGAVVLASILTTSSTSALQTDRNGIFSTQLETDKSVYTLGEPVEVRLTIRNISGGQYGIDQWQPWVLGSLTIFDSHEQRVPVSVLPRSRAERSGGLAAAWFLAPGESQTVLYYQLGDHAPHEWAPIQYWGYRLEKPGTYKLAMTMSLHAWLITDHAPTFFDNTFPSSSVQIEVR
jgi:hypothetical protein